LQDNPLYAKGKLQGYNKKGIYRYFKAINYGIVYGLIKNIKKRITHQNISNNLGISSHLTHTDERLKDSALNF